MALPSSFPPLGGIKVTCSVEMMRASPSQNRINIRLFVCDICQNSTICLINIHLNVLLKPFNHFKRPDKYPKLSL